MKSWLYEILILALYRRNQHYQRTPGVCSKLVCWISCIFDYLIKLLGIGAAGRKGGVCPSPVPAPAAVPGWAGGERGAESRGAPGRGASASSASPAWPERGEGREAHVSLTGPSSLASAAGSLRPAPVFPPQRSWRGGREGGRRVWGYLHPPRKRDGAGTRETRRCCAKTRGENKTEHSADAKRWEGDTGTSPLPGEAVPAAGRQARRRDVVPGSSQPVPAAAPWVPPCFRRVSSLVPAVGSLKRVEILKNPPPLLKFFCAAASR